MKKGLNAKKEGNMLQSWADDHEPNTKFPFYTRKRGNPGKCQNPQNGHVPIFHVHLMRHESSGEVVEIGTHCYQRWCRLRGIPTDIWFDEYLQGLKNYGHIHRGHKLTPKEIKKLKEEARVVYIKKEAKKKKLQLEKMFRPIQNWKTKEQAEKWARDRGGYIEGAYFRYELFEHSTSPFRPIAEKKSSNVKNASFYKYYWLMYTNLKYKKGDY